MASKKYTIYLLLVQKSL